MWGDRRHRVDHDEVAYLWEQVADDVRTEVESGGIVGGQRLPSEPELASLYGVSRVTVRRALQVLIEERVLTRLRGKGTFVTPNR
jgi:GntR family transcriptional regulator